MWGLSNEVEIVITVKNKGKAAFVEAKKDATDLGKKYEETSRRSTSALNHIRDALRHGLKDALADVNGETNRASRAFRAMQESATRGFDQVKNAARAKLKDLLSEKDGKSIGRRLASGIGSGLMAGLKRTSFSGLADGLSGALKGALSTPIVGAVIVGALATAAASAATAVGALLAGGIILGLGTGLVGAGAAALFYVEDIDKKWSKSEQKRVAESNKQAERLRKQYLELGRDVIAGMKRASQPLIPVLDTVRSTLRSVGREFEPVIEKGMKIAKGPLQRFVKDLGSSFSELKPSIAPVMTTFGELLDTIGPQLPGAFREISNSVIEMAGTVSENKDLIGALFVGLIRAIPVVIGLVSGLASAFRGTLVATSYMIDGILHGMQSLMEIIAAIPGPWQEGAAKIAASIQGTRNELYAWRDQVEAFPKVVKLQGEIKDLDRKLASARRQLHDPNLTKTRRAKLQAEIGQLLAAKARAQAAINALRGKTVTIRSNYVTTHTYASGTASLSELWGHAHGGVIGGLGGIKKFASGGVAGAGSSLAMVGEQGPELVRLPVGSSVTGAGQTRAMQQQGGFGNVSMAFRGNGGGSGGGGGGIAGGLQDVLKALRDVITLREGLDKLTGSIFGQERALSAYEAAWDAARKSLKENGKRLSLSTEKGRENRNALLSLAEAAQEVVAAMREKGRSITSVTAKMKEQRAEFIKMARSMGLTSAQAKSMADRYGLIPSKVKSLATKEAKDTAYNKKAEKYNDRIEKAGKASGGIAGGWTMVGERGAELVRLPFGSSVTSANQTAAMMAGGGRAAPVVLELRSSGSAVDDMLLQILRKAVRVRGGDVQLVLGRA